MKIENGKSIGHDCTHLADVRTEPAPSGYESLSDERRYQLRVYYNCMLKWKIGEESKSWRESIRKFAPLGDKAGGSKLTPDEVKIFNMECNYLLAFQKQRKDRLIYEDLFKLQKQMALTIFENSKRKTERTIIARRNGKRGSRPLTDGYDKDKAVKEVVKMKKMSPHLSWLHCCRSVIKNNLAGVIPVKPEALMKHVRNRRNIKKMKNVTN